MYVADLMMRITCITSILLQYKSNFVDNYQSNSTDSAEVQERSEPTKSVTSPTPAASSNNTKNQQQEDKKNVSGYKLHY